MYPSPHSFRSSLTALLLGGVLSLTGCTLPADHGDMDYPAYGGAWQRTRRDSGRVGSLFDPAGGRTATLSPRDELEEGESARSSRDSILSGPPTGRREPLPPGAADPLERSPSDRYDPEQLRSLDLEDIQVERGQPAPPDLH